MERERVIDYVSKTYVNPIREATLDKPKPLPQAIPSPSKLLRGSATRHLTSQRLVETREEQVKVEVGGGVTL